MIISKEAERYRNRASIERIKQLGLSFADAFVPDDEIIIYGFGISGKILFNELYGKRNIVGIIENCFSEESKYKNVSIYQIYNDNVADYLNGFSNLKIVVMPTYDWDEIVEDIKRKCNNVKIYPFPSICAYLELNKYVSDDREKYMLQEMVLNSRKTSINAIHLVDGLHGLLIYLLYNKGCKNTLFLAQTYKPNEQVVSMIKELGGIILFVGDVTDDGEYLDMAKYDVVRALKYYAKYNQLKVYGQDFFPYVFDYLECDFTLIEDGFNSAYSKEYFKIKYPGIYYAMEGNVCYARYEEIKNVIFIQNYEMPETYRKKAEIINLEHLWNDMTKEVQDIILRGFSFSNKLVNEIRETNRKILLVGSNYSGCLLCSKETEIEMFTEVMSYYDEKKMIIKPHPMSDIDYEKVFPNAYIIKEKFPIELLMFCDIGIDTVVGIVSNGIVNLKGIYKIDEYPEIKEKYIEDKRDDR